MDPIYELNDRTGYKWEICWILGEIATYRGRRTLYEAHRPVLTYEATLDVDYERRLVTVAIRLDGSDFTTRVETPVECKYWTTIAKAVSKLMPIAEKKLHEHLQTFVDPQEPNKSVSPAKKLIPVRVSTRSLWERILLFFRNLFS